MPAATMRTFNAAGVYAVEVKITDDDTGWYEGKYEYIVVYDPDAGFVTGAAGSPPRQALIRLTPA